MTGNGLTPSIRFSTKSGQTTVIDYRSLLLLYWNAGCETRECCKTNFTGESCGLTI